MSARRQCLVTLVCLAVVWLNVRALWAWASSPEASVRVSAQLRAAAPVSARHARERSEQLERLKERSEALEALSSAGVGGDEEVLAGLAPLAPRTPAARECLFLQSSKALPPKLAASSHFAAASTTVRAGLGGAARAGAAQGGRPCLVGVG